MKLEFKGSIDDNGKLAIFGRDAMIEMLKAHRGKPVTIRLLVGNRRSNKVNAYYWACLSMIVSVLKSKNGISTDVDALHWKFKLMFNPEYVKDEDGVVVDVLPGTTTELDNQEFFDGYMEGIRQWCVKILNLILPMPGEKLMIFTVNE